MMKTVLIAILLLLAGCGGMPVSPPPALKFLTAADSDFIKANYAAADSLVKTSSGTLDKTAPIIVATLVNIDSLEQSSTLGRSVSEQVATRLANLGYTVKEVKLRGTLFVKSTTGELLLSRELKDISAYHKAQAVVVGTYSDARQYLYLNLKLVDAKNNILSGYDYAIPDSPLVQSMFGPRTRPEY
jgi:TolB-like protein